MDITPTTLFQKLRKLIYTWQLEVITCTQRGEMTWCIYHILMCEPIDVPLPNVSWMLDLKCLKAGTFLSSCFHLWEWQLSRDDNSFSTISSLNLRDKKFETGTSGRGILCEKRKVLYPGYWMALNSEGVYALEWGRSWQPVYSDVPLTNCARTITTLLLFVLSSKHESLEFILVLISAL